MGHRTIAGGVGAAIGEPVLRREDGRLLTGSGSYCDDISIPGQAHACMLRSPHAHARILAIDRQDALALPGVIAVLTAEDALADGIAAIDHKPSAGGAPGVVLANRDGSDKFVCLHFPLARSKALYAGEAVAMVIAETAEIARDAAELVAVDYEALPSVTATPGVLAPGAAQLWEGAPHNLCIDADVGDRDATEAAFARAEHVVRFDSWINRVTATFLEPRAALAEYDRQSGRYTLHAGSGGVVRLKEDIAAVLGVPQDRVRVVCGDVGGNFGPRNAMYPEFALVAWAARRLGRAVKWKGDRQEAFLSDFQGRDLAIEAELALDREGNFLALRGSNISNVGAYTASFTPLVKGVQVMSSLYRMPAAFFRARAVLSNTPPTFPYRSAGRPEAMYVIERLIDLAAREHGFDRVDLRRRNALSEAELPYRNPFGIVYDNGAYVKVMDRALALGHWAEFNGRRAEARSRGRLRGIAVANYIEVTSGAPRERAQVSVLPEGRVEVVIGTMSNGQGHETSFAQLITSWLGVPIEAVKIVTGDTDIVTVGGGSHSARSMRFAGIVIGKAVADIVARGRKIAATLLEAAESDVEFGGGRFDIKGTDRSLGLFEVAAAAAGKSGSLPDDLRGPLDAECDEMIRTPGFPYGCHVCEVEVDPDTGTVELMAYAAVDDVGRAINPLILHGQTHGGIAQGYGQAVLECCRYDAESGQLLSASLQDYALPRASDLPAFVSELSEVHSPTNPLGVRGGGEGGVTPSLGLVVNAIVDALGEFGIRHIEMPATPERVWRAIQAARA